METPNVVKVIVTSFAPRIKARRKFPCHNQNALVDNDIVDMLKVIYKLEQEIDNGTPVDTIIVNNKDKHHLYKEGDKYLDSINGTETKNGKLTVLTRPNVGRSFGGYNYAYQQFRDKYEYWVFFEDDHLLIDPYFIKNSINHLNKHPEVAFVSVFDNLSVKDGKQYCAHGGVGCAHRKHLDLIVEELGSFPYCIELEMNTNTNVHVRKGEIPFTNTLVNLGFDLATYPKMAIEFYYDYVMKNRTLDEVSMVFVKEISQIIIPTSRSRIIDRLQSLKEEATNIVVNHREREESKQANHKKADSVAKMFKSEFNGPLKAFDRIHEGMTAILFATGLSVKEYEPIEGHEDFIKMGVNRIYDYPDILGQLDYYVFGSDYNKDDEHRANIDKICSTMDCVTLASAWRDGDITKRGNIFPEQAKEIGAIPFENNNKGSFATDVSKYRMFGQTIIFPALQLILYTGINTLYLVGVDCGVTLAKYGEPTGNQQFVIWWKQVKKWMANSEEYRDVKVISVNPVGLKGVFDDIYTTSDLD